jgi:hypothetical protein
LSNSTLPPKYSFAVRLKNVIYKELIADVYIVTVDNLILNQLALLIVLNSLILEYSFILVYPLLF